MPRRLRCALGVAGIPDDPGPTRTPGLGLIEAARLLHAARHPRYPGRTGHDLGLDGRHLIAQKDELIAALREKKYLDIVVTVAVALRGRPA